MDSQVTVAIIVEPIDKIIIPTYAFKQENKKAKRNKTNDYLDNDLLRLEIIKSLSRERLTSIAVDMLMLMVDEIQSQFTYRNIADKEDCRSNAIEIVLNNWNKCDINRENHFSFFTTVILNGLYAGWNGLKAKEKNTISFSSVFHESI